MPKKRYIIDTETTFGDSKVMVKQRLMEVAILDYISKLVNIKFNNRNKVRYAIETFLNDNDLVNVLLDLLYTPDEKVNESVLPLHWERTLLYNVLEVKTDYIRKELNLKTTNILEYPEDKRSWVAPTLSLDVLRQITGDLMRVNFTLFNFSKLSKLINTYEVEDTTNIYRKEEFDE